MYAKVKQLRSRGQRRPGQQIAADEGKTGELTLAMCGQTYQLNLNDPASSVNAPLFPLLHEAKLTTMHGDKMLFWGVERMADGAEHVQEWSVLVLLRPQEAA